MRSEKEIREEDLRRRMEAYFLRIEDEAEFLEESEWVLEDSEK